MEVGNHLPVNPFAGLQYPPLQVHQDHDEGENWGHQEQQFEYLQDIALTYKSVMIIRKFHFY